LQNPVWCRCLLQIGSDERKVETSADMSGTPISGCIYLPGTQTKTGALVGPCIRAAKGEAVDKTKKCAWQLSARQCAMNPRRFVPFPFMVNQFHTAGRAVSHVPTAVYNAVKEAWNENLENIPFADLEQRPFEDWKYDQNDFAEFDDAQYKVVEPTVQRKGSMQYQTRHTESSFEGVDLSKFGRIGAELKVAVPEKTSNHWITLEWTMTEQASSNDADSITRPMCKVALPMSLIKETEIERFLNQLKAEGIAFEGASNVVWFWAALNAEDAFEDDYRMYYVEVYFNHARFMSQTGILAPTLPLFEIFDEASYRGVWIGYPDIMRPVFNSRSLRHRLLSNIQTGFRGCQYVFTPMGMIAFVDKTRTAEKAWFIGLLRMVVQACMASILSQYTGPPVGSVSTEECLKLEKDPFLLGDSITSTTTTNRQDAIQYCTKAFRAMLVHITGDNSAPQLTPIADKEIALDVLATGLAQPIPDDPTTNDLIAEERQDVLSSGMSNIKIDLARHRESQAEQNSKIIEFFFDYKTVAEAKTTFHDLILSDDNEAKRQNATYVDIVRAWNQYANTQRGNLTLPVQRALTLLGYHASRRPSVETLINLYITGNANKQLNAVANQAIEELIKNAPLVFKDTSKRPGVRIRGGILELISK
jgi:hypothetical protein